MIDSLTDACLKYYTRPHRQTKLKIDDITLTIRTDGIHRSLHLTIMQKDEETEDEYRIREAGFIEICRSAITFQEKPYELTKNNCVTATAHVLAQFDPNITPPNEWLPWRLDNNIQKYCGKYCTQSTEGTFIMHYQAKINKAVFVGHQHWTTNHKIESVNDIILHAHGKNGGSGERTKSSLIELEWVKEGKNGILEPLESAPQDFKDGLINYNEEVQKNTQEIWELKQQYKAAGGFGIAAYFIFKGDLDKETVIQRLQARALKDKDGPSAKVLQSMQTQGNSEPASSNQESDDYLNLNALKTGQHRKLDPNNPTPTSTFQSFLASLNVTNYEQRTTFLCSQIKDANALLKQLNYEELQGLFKHPLWPQMADKMLNDPDENNSAVYVQAIQKAQDYVAMVDRKLVSAIGEEFNSHLFSDSSKWSAAVANLQESIQSYNGKLLYQFKSDERKSQIKALETLCKELESLSSSALPTKISALSKIIVELSHLSKTIQEGQPGKKSTLASKIDSVKAKVIELFDLSKSPIGLSSQDPMKSLLAYEETRLGDLKVHQSLSHLDSQWWSDEGMAVIKQLPKSCYNYDTVQLLNTTKPSQFDASVVKAIKTDERFISADFAALQKRGRFIQAIEEKNKLIGNSMKQAIALLKDPGNVSQAQAILKAAKATIEELFQDKQEKQWSWFRFKYIVPESGKILNEVIAKLEPYVEQKIAEDPSHSR